MSITADEDEESKERRRQLMLRASERDEDMSYRESAEYRRKLFTRDRWSAGDDQEARDD